MQQVDLLFLIKSEYLLRAALPWRFQEVRGTLCGPWVETSRRSPRKTPSTPNPILDSESFGTVKFPLQEHKKNNSVNELTPSSAFPVAEI